MCNQNIISYVVTLFYIGPGFFTSDLALRLESGGYKITGRQNGAMRIQGVWLNVADVEDQLVTSIIKC